LILGHSFIVTDKYKLPGSSLQYTTPPHYQKNPRDDHYPSKTIFHKLLSSRKRNLCADEPTDITPRQVADTYIAHLVAGQPKKSLELEIDDLRNNPSHESVLNNIRLKNYRVYLVANDENTFVYRFDNNSSQGYYIRLQLHEGIWSNRISGFTSSYLPLDLSWTPR
jgi:hypothetical protein